MSGTNCLHSLASCPVRMSKTHFYSDFTSVTSDVFYCFFNHYLFCYLPVDEEPFSCLSCEDAINPSSAMTAYLARYLSMMSR